MSRARGWVWVALGALAVAVTLAVVMRGAASSTSLDTTSTPTKSSSQTETQRSIVAVADATREDSRQETVGAHESNSSPAGASSNAGNSSDESAKDRHDRGSIEGIAFDWKGNPLVEATIVASPLSMDLFADQTPDVRILSDADGTFSLPGLRTGTWTVESRIYREIGPEKYDSVQVCKMDVAVTVGATIRIELSPPRDGCTVKGKVTQDGTPVSRATVSLIVLWRTDERSFAHFASKTDMQGRYEMYGVPSGTGELTVTLRRDKSETSQAKYERTITIPAGGELEVDVRLDKGGALEGSVIRASDGAILPGVDVYARRRRLDPDDAPEETGARINGQTKVDEHGQFRIVGLEPGIYEVRAGQSLGTDASVIDLAGAIEFPVAVRSGDTTHISFALPRASAVEVEFVDESGSPRAGAFAFLQPSATSTMPRPGMLSCSSDRSGMGRTLHVPPGRYFLDVRSDPQMYSEEFDVVLGRESRVRVQVPRSIVVHAVGRARDGAAVPLTSFSLRDRGHVWGSYWRSKNSSDTESDCACTVAPGRYKLEATADGYEFAKLDVDVTSAATQSFTVVLEKSKSAK